MSPTRTIKKIFTKILNTFFGLFGYEITKIYPDIYLHKYNSYNEYKEIQIFHNKRKIQKVWASKNTLNKVINRVQKEFKNKSLFALCHGSRNGFEQRYLASKLKIKIIGTDISETALNYPLSIVWDFHKENLDWINKCDFIYTNSLDQSWKPDLALRTWLKQLKIGGLLFIEHSEDHGPKGASQMDPFGIKPKILPYYLIKLFEDNISIHIIDTYIPIKNKINYPVQIFVIKKLK
jgi:hypothetical protein